MTVVSTGMKATRIRRFITQFILVVLINVPSISFGLAMGWVSLESGEGGAEDEESGAALVGAAAATFLAGALAMPVAARAIAAGRKPAMLATSAAFIVCWSLKLCGGWGVVVGRAAAGLGGTAAWVIPPMLAVEMCCAEVRGAAAVALVMAHNVGFLLMYLAADYEIPHRTVLLCCLGLSAVHFILYMFVPESPAYLAANGKLREARASLAWCRGYPTDSATSDLDAELKALPEPDLEPVSPFRLAKDMLSDVRRRKAFIIALVAVVGQEMCGVLTLLQFAERVFTLAMEEGVRHEGVGDGGGRKAASDAVVLGAVQLVASTLALYLVEKIGRRPLLVWGAVLTGVCLGAGAGAVWACSRAGALAALAAAVFADSAGLQPAPYALLAEMFTYQYRGCASLLVTAASDLGNAVEIMIFPSIVHTAGLAPALVVAAVLTLVLAAFAAATVPETMDRTPEEIYEILCPGINDKPTGIEVDKPENKRDVFHSVMEVKGACDDDDNGDEQKQQQEIMNENGCISSNRKNNNDSDDNSKITIESKTSEDLTIVGIKDKYQKIKSSIELSDCGILSNANSHVVSSHTSPDDNKQNSAIRTEHNKETSSNDHQDIRNETNVTAQNEHYDEANKVHNESIVTKDSKPSDQTEYTNL